MQVLRSAPIEISRLQESLVETDSKIMPNMYDLDIVGFCSAYAQVLPGLLVRLRAQMWYLVRYECSSFSEPS